MTPYSRKSLEKTLDAISGRYKEITGQEICLDLTELLDEYLIHYGKHFFHKVGVFAIGGYGRRELSRHSDLDLFILYNRSDASEIQEWLRPFLHPLWDARLEVRYSAHTFREMKQKYKEDTDFASALLDFRPLKSNEDLIAKLSNWITKEFRKGNSRLLESKIQEDQLRREKYGETYKLIEPNIKESAGGLRDLHSLQWISVAKGWRSPGVTQENITGTQDFLQWMLNRDLITVREFASLKDAFNFLLQVRHGIHLLATNNRKSNQLDINIRTELAEEFGYIGQNSEVDVQAFMQAYYRAARTVDYAHQSFMNEHLNPPTSGTTAQLMPEFPGIVRTNGSLDSDNSSELPADPVLLLQLFQFAQYQNLQFRQSVREKIEHVVHSMDETRFQTREVGQMLKQICQAPDAGDILRTLLHTDILSNIIPEIAQIRQLHIPSRFHYYTVDEHSFRAIDNLQERALTPRDEDPFQFHKIYSELEDVYPLYLALLLHDIGKAAEGEDHEERGSALVRVILNRLDLGEYVEDVAFLIKNHLLMEQVAFRRDTNRLEVIERFADTIDDPERLRMLYLLTFADISAVSPTLWTDWKATLLFELYWKTLRFLQGKSLYREGEPVPELHENPELSEQYQQHLAQTDERYTTQFSEPEIYYHLQAIRKIHEEGGPATMTKVEDVDAFLRVTVVTTDRPRLLSILCGALSSLGYNIIDAAIFTRDDDIVIDQFRVVPILGRNEPIRDFQKNLSNLLENLLHGDDTIEALVKKSEQQWRWKQQALPDVEPDVQHHTEGRTCVVEVTGRDRVGLLYHLTSMIANHQFEIESARIHTENQSITDIFYILPEKPIADDQDLSDQIEHLEEDLVEFLG